MKINIIILLLNICIIIQQLQIQGMLKDIKKLKNNEEYLRQGINNLYKKMIK